MPCDYKKYPPNWRKIVTQVRERSGDKCECRGECGYYHDGERCAVPNTAWIVRDKTQKNLWRMAHIPGYGATPGFIKAILTTAHLDHDPENHDVSLSRLRHMCQFCHLNYDKHQHAQTRRRNRAVAETGQLLLQEAICQNES
jgi:hypothetical protein